MQFYNRERELALLDKIEKQSKQVAKMTIVVGRRRIGKTSLLVKSNAGKRMLYFFVAKKSETLLCEEFLEEVREKLNVTPYGEYRTFRSLFGYLMDLSKSEHFTLIIDEFQEFSSVNPSVYSDMQNIWDRQKNESRINLILCGSVYSLMSKIFEHAKEPLFGRATGRLHLRPFDISTIKQIVSDYYPDYTQDDLLAFYMVTGGVAKYVELLVEAEAFTLDDILDQILSENSFFLDEGKNVLVDEFGKEYGKYFSILSLIASSKTSRAEVESIIGTDVGGFLERLEAEFSILSKVRPVFAKPGGRTVKYQIVDNFLNFWFRFIYKNRSAVEVRNLNYVRDIIKRDYKMYSGYMLERYFREKWIEEGRFSTIGCYWEKENKNEIDIVGVNDLSKSIVFAEVKRKKTHISIPLLREKAMGLHGSFKGYQADFIGLSLEDM